MQFFRPYFADMQFRRYAIAFYYGFQYNNTILRKVGGHSPIWCVLGTAFADMQLISLFSASGIQIPKEKSTSVSINNT